MTYWPELTHMNGPIDEIMGEMTIDGETVLISRHDTLTQSPESFRERHRGIKAEDRCKEVEAVRQEESWIHPCLRPTSAP